MLLARRGLKLFTRLIEDMALHRPRAVLSSGVPSVAYRTTTVFQESIEEIRSRIFGNHIGNGLRSGRKVLRRKLVGDKVASYYPEPLSKQDPMFVDTDIERYVHWYCNSHTEDHWGCW